MRVSIGIWTSAIVGIVAMTMSSGNADAMDLRIARAPGVSYLNYYVVEHEKLIEKHATALGIDDLAVDWLSFTGGAAMNEALLSGNLDVAAGGVPPFLILWARTADTPLQVKGLCATSSLPAVLTTNNPAIKSLADFTEKDRISVAAVKSSQVAIVLQMGAEKQFGAGNYDKLDHLTVSMPQAESAAAMLSGSADITAHFTVPPFSNRELESPKISRVTDSFEILGGPATLVMTYMTVKFHDEHPVLAKAIVDAFDEASNLIAKDHKAAAQMYVETAKNSDPETIAKILDDPQVSYSTTPLNTMKYADFMNRTANLGRSAGTWKDLFFQETHAMDGS